MNDAIARFSTNRWRAVSGVCALAGALFLLLGVFLDVERLFYAYLAAYAYVVSIALGALLFLMICRSMHAAWPVAIERLTEAIISSLPALLVLFLPLLFGLTTLYPWLRVETVADEHARALIEHKSPYLNGPFFLVRAAFYLATWIVCGGLLRRWSKARDADPSARVDGKMVTLSALALPLVSLTLAFASFDWLMSLEPTWLSTMFPVYVFSGGFVGAIALLSLLAFAARQSGVMPLISISHTYALGRLLLAFTIFWAYAAFFQFFLIWLANKPEEVTFYLKRIQGPWAAVSVALVVGQFVLPFFALLSYRVKRSPKAVAVISGVILVFHYADVHWLVVPEATRHVVFPYHWLDLAALLAVGGVAVFFSALQTRGRVVVPLHDPVLARAQRYESS